MALTNVAQIHRKQGKYDESLHFSTKAIEVNPKLAAAHFEKGKQNHLGRGYLYTILRDIVTKNGT